MQSPLVIKRDPSVQPSASQPITRSLQCLHLALAGLGVLCGLQATAQTVTAPVKVPAKDSEVIELSPFLVSASQNLGYQAASTLAGTRLSTDLTRVRQLEKCDR